MSGSLMGMQGMGSNGLGTSSPQGNIPPGLLQMLLAQMQQGGQMGGGGAGMAQPGLGGPQLPMGQARPMGPNNPGMAPQPQTPQQMPGQMSQDPRQNALAALLQQLKGAQQGVAPPDGSPGQATPSHLMGASGMLPAWLQALVGGGAGAPSGQTGPGGMMVGGN
jgi:hypothetical protein